MAKILSCVDSRSYDLDDLYDENRHLDYIDRLGWYISTWNFTHQTKIRAGKKLCISMTLFMWLCNKIEESDYDSKTISQRLPDGFHERYRHDQYGDTMSIKDASLNVSLSTLRGMEWMMYSSIRPIPDELAEKLNENMMLLLRHFSFFLKGKHPASIFNRAEEFGVEWIKAEHEGEEEDEEEEEEENEADKGKKKVRNMKRVEIEEEEDDDDSEEEKEHEKTEEELIEENMKLLWFVPDDDASFLVEETPDVINEKGEIVPKEPEKIYEASWKLLFMLDTKFAFFFRCHYQYNLTKNIPSKVIQDREIYVNRLVGHISGSSEDELVKHRHEFFLKRIVPYSQIRLYNYFVPFTPDDLDFIPIREPLLWEERSDVAMEEVTFRTFDSMMSSADPHEKTLTIDSLLSYYAKNSMDLVNGLSVVDIIYRKTVSISMDEFPCIDVEYRSNRYVLYYSRSEFYCFDSMLDAFCYMLFSDNMNIFKISMDERKREEKLREGEVDEYTLNLSQLRTCLSVDSTNWDQNKKKKKRKRDGKNVTSL